MPWSLPLHLPFLPGSVILCHLPGPLQRRGGNMEEQVCGCHSAGGALGTAKNIESCGRLCNECVDLG